MRSSTFSIASRAELPISSLCPLHEPNRKHSFSIVAFVFVVAGTCSPSRCLETNKNSALRFLIKTTTVVHLIKIFPIIYGTQKFILPIRTSHWNPCWATRIQSTLLYTINLKSISILSCHLPILIPSGLFLLILGSKTFIHSSHESLMPRSSFCP
jgi:hypothetical protein